MKKIRVMSILGTRPEAVKMAPVIQELKKRVEFDSRVCVTAQHRQMLDQVLDLFNIQPDIDLNLMQPGQSLSQLTAAVFQKLPQCLEEYKPDWVLVQGDTTTVMAASLVSFYHHIKVGHVEAGLRTYDKWQPFPEEINRRIAGVIADFHFAPTQMAGQNLLNEGILTEKIQVTGNTVIDALLQVSQRPYDIQNSELASIPFDKRIVLVTAHRRENFGKPIENICIALQRLAQMYSNDIHLVYPVHLNPNVQEPVKRILGNVPNITLLPPLDYLPMVQLMKRSTLILTDSGGLQEEAPGLGVPVLVLREVTERPEGVQAGTVRLVGSNPDKILCESRHLLDDPAEYQKMALSINPYGDGHSAERIVDLIVKFN